VLFGDLAEARILRDAGIGEDDVQPALLLLDPGKEAPRSARFDTSPRTPVTFPPMAATAAANSDSRRPVMKT